jgi:hypothetical protein
MSETDTVAKTPEPVLPHIVHRGVYTLWEKPDGTLRIQYRRDDRDEDDFMEIPGGILRVAQMVGEGKMNPLTALKAIRGMNGGELPLPGYARAGYRNPG